MHRAADEKLHVVFYRDILSAPLAIHTLILSATG